MPASTEFMRQLRFTLRDMRPGVALLGFATLLLLIAKFTFESPYLFFASLAASGSLFVTGVMLMVHDYLREANRPHKLDNSDADRLSQVETSLRDLDAAQKQLSALAGGFKSASTEAFEETKARLVQDITSSIGEQEFRRVALATAVEKKIAHLSSASEATKARISAQISQLWKFANTNLTIGAGFSVGGLMGLLYFVIFLPSIEDLSKNSEKIGVATAFLLHFLPRLTLVSFIEVFAYFFLRLYRNAIFEIKYFQNEMTNIDAMMAALNAATFSDESALLTTVIGKLSSVERNAVLKKGETTAEILREEVSVKNDKGLMEEYKKLVDMFKPFVPRAEK